jgi:hypothetical protein
MIRSTYTAEQLALDRERCDREFSEMEPGALTRMSDKDLAAWQSGYLTGTPQQILAEHEWDRRLVVRQLATIITAARWQAWFAIFGAIIGSLITLIAQFLAR